jgi:hypothetical protein
MNANALRLALRKSRPYRTPPAPDLDARIRTLDQRILADTAERDMLLLAQSNPPETA